MSKIRMIGYGLLTTAMMACAGHGNGAKESKTARQCLSKARLDLFEKRLSQIDTLPSKTKSINVDNVPQGTALSKGLTTLRDEDNAYFSRNKDGYFVLTKNAGTKIRKATAYTTDGKAAKVTLFSKSKEQSSITNLTDTLGNEKTDEFLVANSDGSPSIVMVKNKLYDATTGQKLKPTNSIIKY